ncbi:MAG: hypothetical protein ACI9LO_001662 [Planctomycetota bacterium]
MRSIWAAAREKNSTPFIEMSAEQIHQVIYASTAVEPLSMAQLVEIMNVSHTQNLVHELTGLLLYAHERFFHVLEGSEDNLRQVYDSIRFDGRHKNIDELRFEPREGRNFDDWQMSFRTDDFDQVAGNPGSRFLYPDFDITRFEAEENEAFRMLLAFRKIHDF